MVRERWLSDTLVLIHGVTWPWVGGSPALCYHAGVCVWPVMAPGPGLQALLCVGATCNLLELITPFIAKRLPILLGVWKFANPMLFGFVLQSQMSKCLKCFKGLYPQSS